MCGPDHRNPGPYERKGQMGAEAKRIKQQQLRCPTILRLITSSSTRSLGEQPTTSPSRHTTSEVTGAGSRRVAIAPAGTTAVAIQEAVLEDRVAAGSVTIVQLPPLPVSTCDEGPSRSISSIKPGTNKTNDTAMERIMELAGVPRWVRRSTLARSTLAILERHLSGWEAADGDNGLENAVVNYLEQIGQGRMQQLKVYIIHMEEEEVEEEEEEVEEEQREVNRVLFS